MNIFAIAAGMMAVIHLVAGWQRPRLAVIVSGILWLLYAVYERLVATGVLCDANCNIRVDLVFFFPILGLATFCAYQSYMGRPSPWKVVGIVLGVIGLVVFGLVAEGHGYGALANVVTVGALAIRRRLCDQIEVQDQSDMTPTVKSGIAKPEGMLVRKPHHTSDQIQGRLPGSSPGQAFGIMHLDCLSMILSENRFTLFGIMRYVMV